MEKVNTQVVKDVFGETVEVVVSSPVTQGSHKVVQASVGAVAIIGSETGDVFDKLVERGEKVEKESWEQIRKAADQPRQEIGKVGDRVNSQIEKMLARLNIPTRSDIQALNQKVTTLTKKVGELNKVQA